MKISKVSARNFQSYSEIDFDYSDLGLSLVSGPTGSGKSTLLDLPAWTLYGITSKDGAADDVRAWHSDEPTTAVAMVQLPDGVILVSRTRGKAGQNDLYFIEEGRPNDKIRGKDLADTQKLIEARLGVSADLFLTGAYMHQFSRADSFFVAKAKERREVMEKIADLSLPVSLAERASEARKDATRKLEAQGREHSRLTGKASEAQRTHESLLDSSAAWEETKVERIEDLEHKVKTFDEDIRSQVHTIVSQLEELDRITVNPKEFDAKEAQLKQQLGAISLVKKEYQKESTLLAEARANRAACQSALNKLTQLKSDVCPTCLGPSDNPNRHKHVAEIMTQVEDADLCVSGRQASVLRLEDALKVEDKLREAYDSLKEKRLNNDRMLDKFEALQAKAITLRAAKNQYSEQVEEAKAQANPFDSQIEKAATLVKHTAKEIASTEKDIVELDRRVAGLTWLYNKSFQLRGMLLEKAVRQINVSTNDYLERFFDASLRVQFSLSDSDKLEVQINNNGYPSPFRQLSGGERCMLKLAFSLSLMRAAEDAAGVKFDMVMLDEALNGLDDGLKVKAFGLLQDLEKHYQTVLLIDHCEDFKSLFTTKYTVEKQGDHSSISSDADGID